MSDDFITINNARIDRVSPPTQFSLTVGFGKPLLTFHADGRVEATEDLKPTETARLVIEALSPYLRALIRNAQP